MVNTIRWYIVLVYRFVSLMKCIRSWLLLMLSAITVDAATPYYGADDDFIIDSCTATQCIRYGDDYDGDSNASYDVAWTCAVMGSSTGKAVSGCSFSRTPKSGFTSSSSTAFSGTWSGTKATSTGTCPWSGTEIARIDSGSSNPNGANITLAMEKECSAYGSGFKTFVSKGGDDYQNNELVVACGNGNDEAALRVYFVCCIPGDCDSCVDPVVSSYTPSADIASTQDGSSSSNAAAVVGSVGAVGLLGTTIVVSVMIRKQRDNGDDLREVLQQDGLMQL